MQCGGIPPPVCYDNHSAQLKENNMETSARNVFSGKVVAVNSGAVNDEVELAVEGGINIVASITKVSTNNLGLKPGASAIALIKASFVLLMNDADKYLLSTRNQFAGTVSKVTPGAVNAEVIVDLADGASIASIVTMGSIKILALKLAKRLPPLLRPRRLFLLCPNSVTNTSL